MNDWCRVQTINDLAREGLVASRGQVIRRGHDHDVEIALTPAGRDLGQAVKKFDIGKFFEPAPVRLKPDKVFMLARVRDLCEAGDGKCRIECFPDPSPELRGIDISWAMFKLKEAGFVTYDPVKYNRDPYANIEITSAGRDYLASLRPRKPQEAA